MKIHNLLFLAASLIIVFAVSVELLSTAIVNNDYLAQALLSTKNASTDTKATVPTTKTVAATETQLILEPASIGDTSATVVTLQKVLNSEGYLISKTGPGSPGNETGYFGPATAASLSTYQKTHNLKVTGALDTATIKTLTTAVQTIPAANAKYEKNSKTHKFWGPFNSFSSF